MTEQWMPKDKVELLSAIEREWNLLLQAAEKLSPEQMSAPDAGGWSPKDNLAHVAEWLKILLGYHIEKRPSHEVLNIPEEITREWDFNLINATLFERNRERTLDDILDELKRVYAQLRARIEAMNFDDLMQTYDPDQPEIPFLAWVLGNTVEHFVEHRQAIEKTPRS